MTKRYLVEEFFKRTKNIPFSSDDFRKWKLEDFLNGSPSHSVGGFFSNLLRHGLIEEIGRKRSTIPSNHGREIREYRWTEHAWVTFRDSL